MAPVMDVPLGKLSVQQGLHFGSKPQQPHSGFSHADYSSQEVPEAEESRCNPSEFELRGYRMTQQPSCSHRIDPYSVPLHTHARMPRNARNAGERSAAQHSAAQRNARTAMHARQRNARNATQNTHARALTRKPARTRTHIRGHDKHLRARRRGRESSGCRICLARTRHR